MNLVADPILTPSKDKKDANRCQPTTQKQAYEGNKETLPKTISGYIRARERWKL